MEGTHSTFHYDLTRTLARASGFNPLQATRIALADQATDTFPNDPQDCATATAAANGEVIIIGTTRTRDEVADAQTQYFHWPRRAVSSMFDGSAYPGSGVDGCQYFVGSDQACTAAGPEVNQLESFALAADNEALQAPVPCYSENGSAYAPIPAGSLLAPGLYLHGLADSYSHEACMATGQRTHQASGNDSVCSSFDWHINEEYGADGKGVAYTRAGAQAIWEALKRYRVAQGYGGTPLWTDAEARAFIVSWVKLDNARQRQQAASETFNSLGN